MSEGSGSKSTMNLFEGNSPENLPVLTIRGGVIVADSREVAEKFAKDHTKIVRAIRNLGCSEEFRRANFGFCEEKQKHSTGSTTINYFNLTRDGLAFLVMGFTGKRAAVWKEKYIVAFNAMDERLRREDNFDYADARIKLDDPHFLRNLLGNYAERTQVAEAKVEELTAVNAELSEDAQSLAMLSKAEGSLCVTDTAKTLGLKPKSLFSYLAQNRWIYRRPGAGHYCAYQEKLARGFLEHKVTTVLRRDGTEKVTEQVRVTPKGLTRLAKLFVPAQAEVG